MNYQRTLDKMRAGGHIFGEFSLPSLEESDNVYGVLRWDDDRGAELELLEPPESWGVHDLDLRATVFGLLEDNTLVTLPNAWVGGYSHSAMFVATLRSDSLLLGTNSASSAEWTSLSFSPAHLHEWYPVTGITKPTWEHDDRGMTSHLVVDWKPEEAVVVELPEAQLAISPTMQTETSFSPENSIRTKLRVHIKPHDPMALGDLERHYLRPMMAFTTITATRWDTPSMETLYNEDTKELVRVLHAGHTVEPRDWRPGDGRYLFLAEDCADIGALIERWFEVDRDASMPLRAFGETYRDGNSYNQGRLIGLVTALEGYCDARLGKTGSSFFETFKLLRDHAGLDDELISCRDDQLKLLWRARNYFTHLGARGGYSPSQLERSLLDCCRIAAALLQACLLRDLGFSTEAATALFENHYRSWPLPTEKVEPENGKPSS